MHKILAESPQRFEVWDGWLTPQGFLEVEEAQHDLVALQHMYPDEYAEHEKEDFENIEFDGSFSYNALDRGWIRFSNDTIAFGRLDDRALRRLRDYLWEEAPEYANSDAPVLIEVNHPRASGTVPARELYDSSVTPKDILLQIRTLI